jgi:hypothetical protein
VLGMVVQAVMGLVAFVVEVMRVHTCKHCSSPRGAQHQPEGATAVTSSQQQVTLEKHIQSAHDAPAMLLSAPLMDASLLAARAPISCWTIKQMMSR